MSAVAVLKRPGGGYGKRIVDFSVACAPFFGGADRDAEQKAEFYLVYKEFIDFQEEFLQPFLDSEGQTLEMFESCGLQPFSFDFESESRFGIFISLRLEIR